MKVEGGRAQEERGVMGRDGAARGLLGQEERGLERTDVALGVGLGAQSGKQIRHVVTFFLAGAFQGRERWVLSGKASESRAEG